jgi:hypothetical protein
MKRSLLLSLLLPLFSNAVWAQEMCAISGTVVDAVTARPVPQVKVFAGPLADQSDSPPPVRRLTNAKGDFCFERLSAGSYKVVAKKLGYLDITYGQQHANGPSLPVMVSADRTEPPLILKIMPQATISGVVTDADGDPIPYGQVRLYKRLLVQSSPSDVNSEWADEQGRFRLWGLAPGTYYVSALPAFPSPSRMSRTDNRSLDSSGHPVREREVETFYKGALTAAGATPIAIKGGQEITGIAIPIQTASSRRIAGRVSWAVKSSGLPRIWLEIMGEGLRAAATVENDGRFHADGLTPGVYTLFAYTPNMDRFSQRQQVDVTEQDADGILLQPNEPVDINVSVHLEGSKTALAFDQVVVEGRNRSNGFGSRVNEDGTWHFGRLPPDVYHFGFWPNPEHYFVKSVLVDGEFQPGNMVDWQGRLPQNIEVVLALSTSVITGMVTNGKEPVPAVTIVLMNEATQESVKQQRVPAGGQFEIKPLAPGKYRLYALEDFDREAWGSDELRNRLASKSSQFELRDGEKRQVSVPLISAQEYEAALNQLAH